MNAISTERIWIDAQMRRHRIRVMVAITVGYGMYYTCRLALSVVKQPLIDEGIFTIAELGFLGSALFYGYPPANFSIVSWPITFNRNYFLRRVLVCRPSRISQWVGLL